MHVRKMILAAAVLGMAALPAHADDSPAVYGYNTGDDGVIAIVFGGLPAANARSEQINTFPLDGTVSAQCEYHQQNRPSSNDAVLIVEGHGTAALKPGTPVPVRAVSIGVKCQVRYLNDTALPGGTAESANESAATVSIPPLVVPVQSGSWRVCAQATVHWSDNSVTQNTSWNCI